MDKSTLYDVLSMGIIQKWRKNEEAQDDYFAIKEQELKEELLYQLLRSQNIQNISSNKQFMMKKNILLILNYSWHFSFCMIKIIM